MGVINATYLAAALHASDALVGAGSSIRFTAVAPERSGVVAPFFVVLGLALLVTGTHANAWWLIGVTSTQVLSRLADVLMLSADERTRLFDLAIPDLRVGLSTESRGVLEAFSVMRAAGKRLWAASSESEALLEASEQLATWFRDARTVVWGAVRSTTSSRACARDTAWSLVWDSFKRSSASIRKRIARS